MAYFRTPPKLPALLDLLCRDDKWLILINADPDAMASAMALQRILRRRVKEVAIAKVNEITRPDNLAMIRYTRIAMQEYDPALLDQYDRFALVDSQPHHHEAFQGVPFSIIIDHHPLPDTPLYPEAPYQEIRPEYGATCTLMVEHLYALNITPRKLLATAMLFGIKTDTGSFERRCSDVDIRAYQFLTRTGGQALLSRISRSEYHKSWLEFFARACTHIYFLHTGSYAFVGPVHNPDILVVLADFFMRVHEINWVAIAGVYEEKIIIVFRSDGISRDVGRFAADVFGQLGSAGGHRGMARAEFSLDKIEQKDPELFVWQEINRPYQKKNSQTPVPVAPPETSQRDDSASESNDWDTGLND